MIPPVTSPSSTPKNKATDKEQQIESLAKLVLGELDYFGRGFRVKGSTGPVFAGQHELLVEPFIAYLEVTHNGAPVHLLVCRNEIPHDFAASRDDVWYVSYKSPVGALAAATLGSERIITIKSPRLVRPEVNRYATITKDEFRPHRDGATWDAIDNRIAWIAGGTAFVKSLRKRKEEPTSTRRVAVKVSLPDQAILDQNQDEVFRMALDRDVVITGAPGTGKTTVLIKRLAQKTRWEFLTGAEQQLFTKSEWDASHQRGNWLLFTPSELLRHYLKEALSREALPASNETVKVWDTFKRTLLRDSRFLKIGTAGVFQPSDKPLLKRVKSTEFVILAKAFEKVLPEFIDGFYRDELRKFAEATRRVVSDLREQQAEVYERALSRTSGDSTAQGDAKEIAGLARRLSDAARAVDLIADRAREVRTEKTQISPYGAHEIRNNAIRAAAELSKIADAAALFPRIAPLGDQLVRQLQALSEVLTFARVFERIPHFYQEFRLTPQNTARFFADGTESQLKDRRVDSHELDVLLFVALKSAREAADSGLTPKQDHSVNVLLAARRPVVAIDEATDFSALEIGCMRLLSLSGAVTICGDLMQRLTLTGLSKWSELDDIMPGPEIVSLAVSYRQTQRLLEMCQCLYEQFVGEAPPFRSAYSKLETDPAPLHFKASPESSGEQWIADRVVEIYGINGQHLPAIGVLVPKISAVRAVADRLRLLLRDHNIEVEASEDGHALGDEDRVRVFAVEHIKGLEFESAFFLNIDQMSDAASDTVARYLYVGLSRARSFLGVTYATQFPRRLQCVKPLFADRASFQEPA